MKKLIKVFKDEYWYLSKVAWKDKHPKLLFAAMMLLRVIFFPVLLPIKLLCKAFLFVYCED